MWNLFSLKCSNLSKKIMISHALLIFISCFLVSLEYGVLGTNWSFSKEEDLELEKQLKRLNKSPIKTISTRHGDIYDCINLYEQPAFDHPLLKNHTYNFEMETPSVHNQPRDKILSEISEYFGLNGEDCPAGTVMIKRLTKEDLLRERAASHIRSLAKKKKKDTHVAVVGTTYIKRNEWAGAQGLIGIYNPFVTGLQSSAARMLLRRRRDKIEAGWRVDPWLYRDNKTHFFVRTEVYCTGLSCFGTRCPGFVVTTKDFPVDGVLSKTSKRGEASYNFQLKINRDPNGNWRLTIGADENVKVGYWPKEIFSDKGLKKFATYIDWGGEVYSPRELPPTIMGYGDFPAIDTSKSAFIGNLTYRTSIGDRFMDARIDMAPYSDKNDTYKVIDVPWSNEEIRKIVFFGGPGGTPKK